MSPYSCSKRSINVDFPHPLGADRTMNKGFVFMRKF